MENHKNDNKVESFDFNEFTLNMIFKIFHENNHYRNGHFQGNRKNHIKGEFLKIREFSLVIRFVTFPLKNVSFGLKMKVLKFHGIQPNYNSRNVILKTRDPLPNIFTLPLLYKIIPEVVPISI